MKNRQYIAFYDNGHQEGEFTFYSDHRANSKPNKEDARQTMIRRFGRRSADYTIKSTMLSPYE